jgi:uncharacterized protein
VQKVFATLALLIALVASAAEVIPPAPPRYFNDYAGVVSAQTAERLNQTLEKFERDSSSQILVAVYPKIQSDSSIEDYTVRVAQSWRAGQKGKDNGAVLFVFTQDHKMFLQVGYGLEGALPDVLCKQIIDREITPRFKASDFDGGLSAGVNAILAAIRGEYKGTGRTVAENSHSPVAGILPLIQKIFGIVFFIIFLSMVSRLRRGTIYGRRGYTSYGGWWGGGGGGWGGGSGGGFSGGGGGFSGGGGSFGGGGAGGSW